MDRVVRVDLGERGYDIRIGTDFVSALTVPGDGRSALVVTDSNTGPLFLADVCAVLTQSGFVCSHCEVPAGETSKSFEQLRHVLASALQAGLDRKSLIVALGGGVVGDLAGFAAACYLRGIAFLQVPTSLLAMVDSAVGGKTGINLPQGKNLVGAFYQPVAVGINLETLLRLPDREYRSGLAEVVKYGVIYDADFFALLERETQALLRKDRDVLGAVIERCCEIKAEVVRKDECEGGLRAILNYGHTFGHALETVCGYGVLLHGEAVSLGMIYANALSAEQSGLPHADAVRIRALLSSLGLPVALDMIPAWHLLREVMSSDKKADRHMPTFVLAERIGAVRFGCRISEDALVSAYTKLCALDATQGGS